MAEQFGDWRDAFRDDATALYMDVLRQHEPALAILRVTDPEMAVMVTQRAMEKIAPLVVDEFELRLRAALAEGWQLPKGWGK